MKIELLKPYGMLPVGEVVDFAKPIADLLIQRKVAKKVVRRKKK